jgi:very-short-patch-repair endonuclease
MGDRRWLVDFARRNRRDPGLAELRVWSVLSHRALGVKFRRQDPIGPFIVDFSCRAKRLVIEIDDASHTDAERDRSRDAWLQRNGWFVLRIDDVEVLEAFDETVELIQRAIVDPKSIANPRNLS